LCTVISHAHYDHLSLPTVQYLNKRANTTARSGTSIADSTSTHFFAPLGNKKWFEANGIAKENCSELDWWDQAILQIGGETEKFKLRLTATPCQHFANRGLFDRNKTLWAGWAVEQLDQGEKTNCKVFFGGDTAYKGRPRNLKPEDEENLPHCPAFKEVGQKFGGFDFSVSSTIKPNNVFSLK
jgi:N-acyl-phosphatidylethanolamine-hydrolysing phospholipase D